MGQKKVIVIGAGPAGMMAAISASRAGANVVLIEKNAMLGRKLLLTGKGRCNLTNECSLEDFLKRFSKNNAQFLRDAFKNFFVEDLISFFESLGLKTKTERQQRVFPKTDKSSSIVKILSQELTRNKVKIYFRTSVKGIKVNSDNCVVGVVLFNGEIINAHKVIIATGGVSYQFTGSTGDGIEFSKKLGHSVVSLRPGLIALETKQKELKELSGVTLKNISLTFRAGKKEIVSDVGEFLFTDFGVSGPIILSMSGTVIDWIYDGLRVCVEIDFKPGLSFEQLDARFLKDFKASPKKNIKNTLKDYLPRRLVDIFLIKSNIPAYKSVNQISAKEREGLVSLFKCFPIEISKSLPIEEAMVTRGGISLKEINPRTMESKKVKGLYFAGEMIDVDGDTGGFNLQAAFSTGYLAGKSAADC